MEWTRNQREAIEYRGGNLLVSAGAGAGKTGVLSRRIIARLEEGHNIDDLLVLTYTRAAAKEMRDRIRKNIYDNLSRNKRHFSRQLLLLSDAPIMTIHSFCLLLLRRHFNLLPDLEPKFKILDPNQAKVVREDLLRDFFERQYLDDDIHRRDRFLRLLRYLGDRLSDEGLKQQILTLMDFGRNEGDLKEWTMKALERYQDRSFWQKKAEEQMRADFQQAKELFTDALAYCESAGGPDGYRGVLAEDIAGMESLQATEWAKLKEMELSFSRLSGKKKSDDPLIADEIKKKREAGKTIAKSAFTLAQGEEAEDVHVQMGDDLTYLVELTLAFEEEYRQYKRKKSWMEFSDLEQYAYQLLSGHPALAEEYRNRFLEIFVDEYQDINDLQGKILSFLTNGENMFMVGDVKQSIYGFRGANHRIFQNLYHQYGNEVPNAKGYLVTLNENFRSCSAILQGVNFVFSQMMFAETAGLHYDDKAALYPGLSDAPPQAAGIEMLFVSDREEGAIDEDFDYPEKVQAQARVIGERIEAMVESGVSISDQGERRPISYGDFAVLLRNDVGRIQVIENELKCRGIPVDAVGDDSNCGQEVRVLLALLAVLDNPRQDIPLAAVLRSPLFGFDEEELFQIGRREKGERLWDALQRAYEEPLAPKIAAFLAQIEKWRQLSKRHGVGELLLLILEESDYGAYYSALPNGRQRIHHILAFQERAMAFEAQQMGGIFAFLRYMERLEPRAKGEGGGHGNAVQVMTMHRAKGLEFPVVFLANLEHRINNEDSKALLALHRELGFGPKVKDWAIRVRYPTLARRIIEREMKKESIAEEMRVLYVAMTRAKEKLVLVAGKKAEKPPEDFFAKNREWSGLTLPVHDIIGSNSYLDWLGMAFGRHQSLGGKRPLPFGDFAFSYGEIPAPGPYIQKIAAKETKEEERLPIKRLEAARKPERRHLPLKVTVSELLPKTEIPRRPLFQKTAALSGAEQGTVFHRLMEALPFDRDWELKGLEEFASRLLDREILTEEEVVTLDYEAVLAFLKSSYGKILKDSPVIRREMAFTAGFPAGKLFPGESEERVLLQGAVDLLFKSAAGDWFLLDYKNMAAKDPEAFLRMYRRQMELYCEAVENLYALKIKKGAFYLTKERDFITVYPSVG